MTTSTTARPTHAIAAGALAGLAAGLVFAVAHAFIIVPIWDRMLGGLAGAAFVGGIIGWSYFELMLRRGGSRGTVWSGALFGAALWAAVAPVTLVDAALRTMTFLPRFELVGVVIAVVVAVAAGALLGWRLAHTRRAVIAGAAATLFLTIAMAGPVPIGRSIWAVGIFVAVLPACMVAGAVLAAVLALMAPARLSAPGEPTISSGHAGLP